MTALITFLISFAVSYVGTVLLLRSRPRRSFVDLPNERSSHDVPKPRFGGIALAAGLAAAFAFLYLRAPETRLYLPAMAGAALLFLTGLVDDWKGLGVRVRLLVQVTAALIAVRSGVVIDHVYVPVAGEIGLGALSIPLTVLFFVACVNFYNFIDGIDGLAAGGAFIGTMFLALIALILGHGGHGLVFMAIGGAAIGFLQFNFPPSRLFMGDSGSTVLGYLIAYMAVVGNGLSPEVPLFIPFLVFSSLFLDAGLTLIRRALRGEKVFAAHHTHYYQRLLSLGLNHKQVTLLEYLFMVLLGVSAVLYFKAGSFFALFLSICWFSIFTLVILKIRGLERGDRLVWERRTLFVIGADIALISMAYVGAYFLRMNFQFTEAEGTAMVRALPLVLVVRSACFYKYGLYRSVWRYTSVSDVVRVIKAVTTGSIIIMVAVVLLYRFVAFPRSLFVIEYFLLILFILGARFSLRLFHEIGREPHGPNARRYAIVGAGDFGERAGREIRSRLGAAGTVVCYLDDDPRKKGLLLHGVPIAGSVSRLRDIVREYRVDVVTIAVRHLPASALAAIAEVSRDAGVELQSGGRAEGPARPDVAMAMLTTALGRTPVEVGAEAVRMLRGRRVLVTRGGDRIGSELVAELTRAGASVTAQFDNARARTAINDEVMDDVITHMATIGDDESVRELVAACKPDIVIHCVSLDPPGEAGVDSFLWQHAVRDTDCLTRVLAGQKLQRLLIVCFWGAIRPGSIAARTGAIAEARSIGFAGLASVPTAVLRLPRVLTRQDLYRVRGGANHTFDLSSLEAAVLAVRLASQSMRGLFVPKWSGELAPEAVRSAGEGRGGVAVAVTEDAGPLFPAERAIAVGAATMSVAGPLYPANDVFRRVLASAPVDGEERDREEWMRVMAGQLYHVSVPGRDARV